MIVECINNEQAKAPDVFENGYRHPEYIYNDITPGAVYVVYGIGIFLDDLQYLIRRDDGDARWYSPYLFEVRDGRLPPYWEFKYNLIEGAHPLQRRGWRALWGYRELVRSAAHRDALFEEVEADLEIFEREVARRAELGY